MPHTLGADGILLGHAELAPLPGRTAGLIGAFRPTPAFLVHAWPALRARSAAAAPGPAIERFSGIRHPISRQ
jgi:hypothetical protein